MKLVEIIKTLATSDETANSPSICNCSGRSRQDEATSRVS
jgi:hypothetical protein